VIGLVEKKTQDLWPLLKKVVEEEGIARQHINSYNEFIRYGVQVIVDEIAKIEVETLTNPYTVQFGKVRIGSPRVTEHDASKTSVSPMEARMRNLTYSAPVELEMKILSNGVVTDSQYLYVGDLPVMVKSELCTLSKKPYEELIEEGEDYLDPGGYFIINGSERVIVGLEDLAPNKILVDVKKQGGINISTATVYSSVVGYRSKLEISLHQDGVIYARFSNVPTDIPVVVLMRALGLESDKEIVESISLKSEIQDFLGPTFDKSSEVVTVNDALVYLGNRVAHGLQEEYRVKRAENVLDWGLLPHLGKSVQNRMDKVLFIGEAVCKLLEFKLEWINSDDKDHYGNKVIRLAGQLLADLFRTCFRNLIKDMKYQLEHSGQKRGIGVVNVAIRPGIITDKLRNAIATGNWGRGKVGITQLLDRTNYLSTISHLRRIQSPLSRSQPNFEARDLHPTHFGRICPCETPEGSNCGLVKNLALSAVISVSADPREIFNVISQIGLTSFKDASNEVKMAGARVFLDSSLSGYVMDTEEFCSEFRNMRRNALINSDVSIYLKIPQNPKAETRIYINAYSGRVLRPLIVVKNGSPLLKKEDLEEALKEKISWRELLKKGELELVDANEEENCLIATKPDQLNSKHSHLEISMTGMLGAVASVIPYAEHNQSPRNTYESAMAKQALGFPSPIYKNTMNVRAHLLVYPQKPMVTTGSFEMLNLNDRPLGQNAIVAVMSYEGYNIEDAIVMNKSSVERGFGRTFFFRLYEAEAQLYLGGMKDRFEVPNSDANIKGYRGDKFYRLLESDGAIIPEANVSGGDVLIGRTSPPRFTEEYREIEVSGPYMRDTSVSVRPSETGIVDSIIMSVNVEGGKMFKIKVRDLRVPEIGDKFASRHGQKGILGLLANPEDLPYTEEGVIPDIILNPHAFPSRMTVGQFIESMGGKVGSLRGTQVDGSTFCGETVDSIEGQLKELGFVNTGKEVMYDGRTGRRYPAEIFVGVVYYQKLHHMVADKIHARARGQVQMLTKQPTEGRSRGGGLRFGEMERDCLIAYGTSMVLKDRLLDESDKTDVFICENCGLIAYFDARTRKYICRICGPNAKIATVSMAYAFKLLVQEMMSLNILPRVLLKDKI
jgi:DNA-directed RNA polymerase subunit B